MLAKQTALRRHFKLSQELTLWLSQSTIWIIKTLLVRHSTKSPAENRHLRSSLIQDMAAGNAAGKAMSNCPGQASCFQKTPKLNQTLTIWLGQLTVLIYKSPVLSKHNFTSILHYNLTMRPAETTYYESIQHSRPYFLSISNNCSKLILFLTPTPNTLPFSIGTWYCDQEFTSLKTEIMSQLWYNKPLFRSLSLAKAYFSAVSAQQIPLQQFFFSRSLFFSSSCSAGPCSAVLP